MRGFLALLKRELRSITREKTIMFAVIVQFFIASFSSIIMVGIMAFYDPSSIGENANVHIRAGVIIDTESGVYSDEYNALISNLSKGGVNVEMFSGMDYATGLLEQGRLDTVIGMTKDADGVVYMNLIMPELDTKQTVVYMVLDQPLKDFETWLRDQAGVKIRYANEGGASHTTHEFLYSLIVPILMLFPALIAGSIVIDTVSEEFENKTFDTLTAAPVSIGQVTMSKIAAAVITAAVQMGLWVGLLRLNDIVVGNAVLVITLGIIIATIIAAATAIMALYFKDRERTQFFYSIVLVALIGGSYFLDPSPFGLITRLASGDPNIGIIQVSLYAIPLIAIGIPFLQLSRRLVLSRS
jgi:ABC-type Na+ efflux pump permease subunit